METFQGGEKLYFLRDGRIEGAVAKPFWTAGECRLSHETLVFFQFTHDPFISYHSIEKTR